MCEGGHRETEVLDNAMTFYAYLRYVIKRVAHVIELVICLRNAPL